MSKKVQKDKVLEIGVIGAGAWGTALASLLAAQRHRVSLWALETSVQESIQRHHENKVYLPGIILDGHLKVSADLACVAEGKDFIFMAVPSQYLREILEQLKSLLGPKTLIVNVAKGIELKTGLLLSEIYEAVLSAVQNRRVAYLSGPSFALEVAKGLPAAVTVASHDPQVAKKVQTLFAGSLMRIYTSADVIGVELGGALKNVMAIAIGILDGLDLGLNARAGMITRGLHEMTRLGHKMGASPLTFMGLAGLGDLILTCTGDLSRNRQLGLELAHGKKLKTILKTKKSVAEGVATSAAVHLLARRYRVDMPISEAVYKILHKGQSINRVILDLAARPLKKEGL